MLQYQKLGTVFESYEREEKMKKKVVLGQIYSTVKIYVLQIPQY